MAESDREDAKLSDAQRTTPGGVPEKCPKCGGDIDYAFDIGTIRSGPGCSDCHWTPAATPWRSSLPPGREIVLLIQGYGEAWAHYMREHAGSSSRENTKNAEAISDARRALEAAIASLGLPSGDLERAAKVAVQVYNAYNVRPQSDYQQGAAAAADEIERGIRALASPRLSALLTEWLHNATLEDCPIGCVRSTLRGWLHKPECLVGRTEEALNVRLAHGEGQ